VGILDVTRQAVACYCFATAPWFGKGGSRITPARILRYRFCFDLIATPLNEVITITEVAHGYTAPTQVQMKCFIANYNGEMIASGEIEAIAWLNYNDRQYCAPAAQRVLEHLFDDKMID
jgi:hypothetical protein